MTTCETASALDPDDEWVPEDCVSELHLPRRRGPDPGRVREEHPVRAGRRADRRSTRTTRSRWSAAPRRTSSSTRSTCSYGTKQPVAVDRPAGAERRADALRRSTAAGRARSGVREWQGGERYGDTNDEYYAELRGTVTRRQGRRQGRGLVHRPQARAGQGGQRPFTYTVARRHRRRRAGPRRRGRDRHSARRRRRRARSTPTRWRPRSTAAGRTSDVYDFDTQGRKAPHHARRAVALQGRGLGDRRRHHPAGAGPGRRAPR